MNKWKTICLLMAALLLGGCSGNKDEQLKQAEELMEKNDYTTALEQYNKAIMEDESLQLAYRGAGIASLKLGEYEKAEDYFLRALKESDGIVESTEIDISYYLAETEINLEKYDEALETYSNILELDSKETQAYLLRGSVYAKSGNIDKAKKDFNKSIQADKKNIEVYSKCYESLSQNGYKEEGETYLQKGLDCEAESKEDCYIKGKLYAAAGDEAKALEELSKSKQQGYSPAVFYLANLYEQKQDYDTAITFYDEYEKIANLSVSEYQAIAECKMKKEDYTGAFEVYQKAMEQAGESQKKILWFSKIVLYERSGDFATAKTEVEDYLGQYPDDAQALHEYEFLKTR